MTEMKIVEIEGAQFTMFRNSKHIDVGIDQTIIDIKGFNPESKKRVFFLRGKQTDFEAEVSNDDTSHASKGFYLIQNDKPHTSKRIYLIQDDIDAITSHIDYIDTDETPEVVDELLGDLFDTISNAIMFFGKKCHWRITQ